MMKNKAVYLIVVILLLMTGCQQAEPQATDTLVPLLDETPEIDLTPEPTEEETEPALIESASPQLPLVDDFELQELNTGQDGYAPIGFITWSDGSAVSIDIVEVGEGDELALPDQVGINTIIQLNTDIGPGGWSGFSHAFTNSNFDSWVSQDWSPFEGVSFWLYGNNTGGTLFMDILDNRNANSSGDDAERWTAQITDDFDGWQQISIPFTDFVRKDIGNSAPNDGFTLTEVHGYAVGAFGSVAMGEQTNYLDQIMLYGEAGERPVEVKFADTNYRAKEGGLATVDLELNKPASEPVSVQIYTIEGEALPILDYTLDSDTVVFDPGTIKQSFKISAVDDSLAEGQERTLLVLTNPTGAVLNPQARAIFLIRDNDPNDPNLIYDFDIAPPFIPAEGTVLAPLEVAPDSPMALADQIEIENILEISVEEDQLSGGFTRMFPAGQDWREQSGLSFWFYGQNSGEAVTVELLGSQSTTTADVPSDNWELIWSDEFNDPAGTSPNPGIWKPEIGDGMLNGLVGWGNGEFEYYTDSPENASTDGEGNLVITAKKIEGETHLLCWYGPCEYTSARLITWGNAEFEYGRVEARLKLPYGQGLWPAFWMLGTNLEETPWPQSGEIDIMENIGREPATIHGTVHGPGYSGGSGIGNSLDLQNGNYSDDFHVFAIEWLPDQIRWFMDDENFFTLTSDDIPSGTEWVYNHPFFIILNVAVGGNWPGSPDETTTFPQTMQVDYVRVYGAPNTSERFEYRFVDDFEGWQKIFVPFDSLTRRTDQPDGARDEGINLAEIWGYGFEFPANGVFYLDKLRFETE